MKIGFVKWITLVLTSFSLVIVTMAAPARAEIVDRQYSPTDLSNESFLDTNYDIESLEIGFSSDDSDLMYFWIHFKNSITDDQFIDYGKEPWAALLLFRTYPDALGGDRDDIRISTNSEESYSGNYGVTANAYGNKYSGQARTSLSSCNPQTWTDLDSDVKWVGFSISRSCANIPDQFWLVGYADGDATNSTRDFDYGPDSAWYVDISEAGNGGVDEVYLEPQTIRFYQASDILLTKKSTKVAAYSDSGLAVYYESLTPKVCKSLNYTNTILLISVGTCKLSANQDGDDYYEAADTRYMSFKVVKSGTKIKSAPKPAPVPTPTPKSSPKATPRTPSTVGGKTRT